jgi:two-component system, NarL family, sensor histidine kinase UhpB
MDLGLTREEAIMQTSLVESRALEFGTDRPWRDAVLVVGATLLSITLSVHFELNEAVYALTRRAEYLQLDELPVGMLVLLIGLIWLSWKRHRHAQRELRARRIAEAALADVVIENRQLAKENLRIQEVERKHLARELHDELGQYLNAIKLDAVSILDNCATGPAFSANAAGAIIRTVDHVHNVVSDMIGRLRPVGLDELGLVAAIEHCVDRWRERLPSTRFQLSVSGNWEELGETLNLTVYRLIQEGLTNVYRHANAKQVSVALDRTPVAAGGVDELRLSVSDDGCGMAFNSRTTRFGLCGMRERVEMVGGKFVLDSAPGRGLRFEAVLPGQGDML